MGACFPKVNSLKGVRGTMTLSWGGGGGVGWEDSTMEKKRKISDDPEYFIF